MRRAALGLALALLAARASGEPEVATCGPAQAGWRPGTIDLRGSPVDLRFLNHTPAGAHGFVRRSGDGFAFANGTPARFWGVNVVANAIFNSSDEEIDWHAERIARLGFNLVRFHHHDSAQWLKGGGLVRVGPNDSRSLNPAGLAKLDRWVARLREHGVYVFLDLHTGRVFHPGDEIPGFEEVERRRLRSGGMGHGFLYVNERLQELVIELGEKLLAHENSFTRTRYRDEPALAAVLITNEDDVAHHYGNLFAADAGFPWHRARFLAEVHSFAKRTKLPEAALQQTWKPGPARLLLADLEHGFFTKARTRLRAAGLRAPLVLTSFWNAEPLYALPSLASGDFVDVHVYLRGNPLQGDPRKWGGAIARIGAAQLPGQAVLVSEWNHGEPRQRERASAPLWLASVGALQGWDGLLVYAYAQSRLSRVSPVVWNTAVDPAIAALLPAAGVAFRRGDVALAKERAVLAPSAAEVWNDALLPERYTALATLVEQHRVELALPGHPALPWLKAPEIGGMKPVAVAAQSFVAPDARRIRSDTGELARDFARGLQTIDTPRTQAASGNLNGQPILLSQTQIRADRLGAVAFTSLDGLPLARSERVLVSVAARACAESKTGSGFRAEPIAGEASLASDFARVLVPIGPRGERGSSHPLTRDGGRAVLPLDFGGAWALLERAAD